MTSNSSLAFDTNSKTKPINLVDPTKLINSFTEFHSTSFTETKTTEKAQRELTRLRKKLANNSNQDDLSNQLNFKNSILYFQSASNFADKYYNSLKNNNQNMETSTNTASSLSFMNRIKTLESKSKRTNTPYTTQTNQPSQANFVNSNAYQQTVKPNRAQKTNDFYENSYLNFSKNYTSTSPTNDRKPKPRSTNIDEQQTRYRLNAYQDKLPDHKFFNRNYKPTEMVVTNRCANDSPSPSNANLDPTGSSRHNSGEVNKGLTSTSMNLNRLKLLKKRNALKKSIATTNQQSTSPTSKSHTNFEYNYTLIANSKEDFKSQTSLNNTMTNKAYSNHLSRNSLNNTESYLGSNHQLTMNKSSETIDELHLAELRAKSTNFNNSLNRVRSTPHINNQSGMPAINGRTKSENELINLPEADAKSRFKTVSQINLFNNKSNKSRPVSRLDNKKKSEAESATKALRDAQLEAKSDQLKVGFSSKESGKSVANQIFDMKLGVDAFEPSPYNIMSDPVISEQFKKLYEEDEYFQQVHKKCCEWLNKYVYPSIENSTYALSSTSASNSRSLK